MPALVSARIEREKAGIAECVTASRGQTLLNFDLVAHVVEIV
jgi:hypothetical protein